MKPMYGFRTIGYNDDDILVGRDALGVIQIGFRRHGWQALGGLQGGQALEHVAVLYAVDDTLGFRRGEDPAVIQLLIDAWRAEQG